MHAQRIVDRFVNERLALHAARRPSWGAAIWAAMRGRVLSLSSLARAIAGGGTVKSALKRMERLVGGARVESEAQEVAAALLGGWRCLGVPLAIAVDWSALDPGSRHVEWRAAVTWLGMGRGLTVYSRVCPLRQLGSAKVERALLAALRGWIAADVQVVIVTDAGFRRPWFAQVEALGWGWIGRVRAGVKLGGPAVDGQRQWGSAQQWFAQATGCAQRHSDCALTRRYAWGCDLVLWHGPRRERTEYRRAGRGGTAKARGAARRSAAEPWVLAHSPRLRHLRPDEIVAMYARRMQIEEHFRDTKSIALGMGLEHSRSRSAPRLHALLPIHTVAAFLLWHIGQWAESEGLQRRVQLTSRKTREPSVVRLAVLLCAHELIPLSATARRQLGHRLGVRL